MTSSITPNTIDFGAGTTTGLLNVRKLSGALLIKNVNTATKIATIEFSGGKIELDDTNTAGSIGIAGIPDTAITDNSNGSSVLTVGVFPSAGTNALAVWDNMLTSGYTAEELLDLIACVNAAKLSGADTTTISIRNLADTKDRVVATVDNDGNRSAVTRDVS